MRKQYVLEGQSWYYGTRDAEQKRKEAIKVFVEFDNKGGELGHPLPKGVMRVYKKDSAGHALFVGEDGIDHTAKNETVRLALGSAFDVSATRTQTAYRQIAGRPNPVFESGYRVELSNAKQIPVTVTVNEPMTGDWEMLSESHRHTKADAHTAKWQIQVPPDGRAILEYTIRVK